MLIAFFPLSYWDNMSSVLLYFRKPDVSHHHTHASKAILSEFI